MSEMKKQDPQDDSNDRDSKNRDLQVRREAIDASIWLDRLVDGEIGDDEQRQLLLSLESQPDGWRRCALTFIEAQTLRKDLQGVGNNLEVAADGGRPMLTSIAAKRRGTNAASHRVRWLAMAACFALAFVIGSLTRGIWTSSGVNEVAKSSADAKLATNVGGQESVTGTMIPGTTTSGRDTRERNPASPMEGSSQGMQLAAVTADGNSEQQIEVPVSDASPSDIDKLLTEKKPVLSEAELKALENTGRLVGQRRALYPVQLQDGRVAVVPVDLVEVRDTGGWQ
jgi:hypothetical protein